MRGIGFLAIGLALLAGCSRRPPGAPSPYVGKGGSYGRIPTAQMRIEELEKDKQAYLKTAQEMAVENARLKAHVKDLEGQVGQLKAENEQMRARVLGTSKPPYSERSEVLHYGASSSPTAPKEPRIASRSSEGEYSVGGSLGK